MLVERLQFAAIAAGGIAFAAAAIAVSLFAIKVAVYVFTAWF